MKGYWLQIDCSNLTSTGCHIASGIAKWIGFMLQISLMGFTFIFFISIGESNLVAHRSCAAICSLLLGAGAVCVFTIIPYYIVSFTPMNGESAN